MFLAFDFSKFVADNSASLYYKPSSILYNQHSKNIYNSIIFLAA